jgi:hypothetical protein
MLLPTRTGDSSSSIRMPRLVMKRKSSCSATIRTWRLAGYRCTVQAVRSEFLELGKAAAAVAEQGERVSHQAHGGVTQAEAETRTGEMVWIKSDRYGIFRMFEPSSVDLRERKTFKFVKLDQAPLECRFCDSRLVVRA